MAPESSEPVRLSASSAVVLGLLAREAPQTTYDMLGFIEISIGFFWPFPTSQMYAETKRLEAAGLIVGTQEDFGRRRRQFDITEAGREALADWVAEPVDRHTEIRDVGLLKFFLADSVPEVSIDDLVEAQVALHRTRLDRYREIESTFGDERGSVQRSLELGLAFERAAIDFWESVDKTYDS